MARGKAEMQIDKLKNRLAEIEREIDALKQQRNAFKEAILLLSPESDDGITKPPRGYTKKLTLRLLTENGSEGIDVERIMKIAVMEGYEVQRGSVSSLLSRLKSEGTAIFDDDKKVYKLSKYSPPTSLPGARSADVLHYGEVRDRQLS